MNSERMERIRAALAVLEPTHLDLVDESHLHAGHAGARTGLGHFRLAISSARFSGLNPIARHRLVYRSLGDLMKTDIHALSIDARVPKED